MRYPRLHKFLAWFGPSVVVFVGALFGLVIAAAEKWDGVAKWAEQQFFAWWPIVTAGWFVVTMIAIIAIYFGVLIFSSGQPKVAHVAAPSSQQEEPPVVPVPPAPPAEMGFKAFGNTVKCSQVLTETGEVVPDLWCVGIYLRVGNTRSDARTLRNVSAEIDFIMGPIGLPFEGGQRRSDIRTGEQALLQVGYTFHSEYVGFLRGDPVTLNAERIAEEKERMVNEMVVFGAGHPTVTQSPKLQLPDDPETGDLPFSIRLTADDVPFVVADVIANVSWAAKQVPDRLILRPGSLNDARG